MTSNKKNFKSHYLSVLTFTDPSIHFPNPLYPFWAHRLTLLMFGKGKEHLGQVTSLFQGHTITHPYALSVTPTVNLE